MRPINHFTWLRLKYVSESNMWQQDEHLCLGLHAAAKYNLQFFASLTNFCIHCDFPLFSLLFTKFERIAKGWDEQADHGMHDFFHLPFVLLFIAAVCDLVSIIIPLESLPRVALTNFSSSRLLLDAMVVNGWPHRIIATCNILTDLMQQNTFKFSPIKYQYYLERNRIWWYISNTFNRNISCSADSPTYFNTSSKGIQLHASVLNKRLSRMILICKYYSENHSQ